jgi:hypothetical protein
MKHFNALTEVENQIIRLASMRDTYNVIINGAEQSSKEELISAMEYIQGSIEDIADMALEKFQILFDSIAHDEDNQNG